LVNISSSVYNLDKEYIYLGTNKELDLSKINALNCKLSIDNNKLVVKYDQIKIDEYVLLNISFGNLSVDKSVIILDDDIIYDEFISYINASDGITYKIYNGDIVISNGYVLNGMHLKLYYNDDEIGMYSINNYNLVVGSKLVRDKEKKIIFSNLDKVLISDFFKEITVTGGNVKLIVTTENGVAKKENDYIGTGDVFTIYVNNVKKDVYTLVVMGDTSGDGIVNSLDLVMLRKHIVEYRNSDTSVIEIRTGVYKEALDISGDNMITSLDLVRMRKKIVGLE